VGVYLDGHGATALLRMLSADSSLAAFPVRSLSPASLEAALGQARALVIPQPFNRWLVDRGARERLRAWIAAGGALLVTHDMVGLRGARAVVPEVCRRGTGYPRSAQWQVTAAHPAVAGVPTGLQLHSYYDHITVEPGPDGQVLATDAEGRPVLAVGAFGSGRYAALGLVPGLAPDDSEVEPAGAERALVEALIRWLVAP
jgi:hypothetical protein